MIMCERKSFPEAIEQLEEANRMDESYPMAHLYLGIALMGVEPTDFDRAEREMLRARELGGAELAYVRMHLFNLNIRRNTLNKAAEQLEAYLKEAPEASNALAVRETLGKIKTAMAQQPK